MLSLVIPVYNEHDSLTPLLAEITEVVGKIDQRVEIIFVDDGSTDGSWQLVRELSAKDERVRGIRFRRNFGKAAALEAGFKVARGGVVMTLDADLQDDPHEIPNFLAAIRNGLDVVSGWKKIRLDPWHKTFPSRVFNRMVGWVTKVHLHDHNCGFKAYRADVLRELNLYGEMHRFVPVLAAGRGFKVGELAIHHRPRQFGRSKYGWQRFVKGFLDLVTVHFLTKFGRRPQHLLGSYGLLAATLGFLGFFGLLVNLGVQLIDPTIGFGTVTQLYVLLLSGGLVLGGAQLLFTGLLAELVVARKMMEQEPFSVVERTATKG
ncbi:MAG: glycosyltransferase [Planctomycetaceae bacterium]|nr:glycosyltransferase [Planctomycetaceae bacterium]